MKNKSLFSLDDVIPFFCQFKQIKVSIKRKRHSLELFMQREGDLWRDVDEALTEQKAHRLGRVIQDLLELFCYTVRSVLLTLVHNQLLDLLHALNALQQHHI